MSHLFCSFAALCLAFAPAPVPKPGRERALRVELDPVRLSEHGLTTADVRNALTPSGLVNDPDAERVVPCGAYSIEVVGTPARPLRGGPKEFGNVVLRATPEGEVLRLKDVARLRLRAR